MTLRFFGLFLFFPVLFPFVSHLSSPRTSHRALPLHGDPCRCTVPKRKQLTYSLHLSTGCVILSPAYAWNCTTHQGIAPIDGLKVGAYYQPDTVRLKSISQIKPPPDNRHTEPSRRDRSRQVRGLVFCDLCAQIESSFSQHQFHQLPAGSQYSLQITIESTNVASVSSTAVLKVAPTILLRVHESYAGQ